jgi:hypothetical protein
METIYKWATIGILLLVFIGLMSYAGCGFHVAEFIGSIMIAIVAARLFYFGICKNHSDHFVH